MKQLFSWSLAAEPPKFTIGRKEERKGGEDEMSTASGAGPPSWTFFLLVKYLNNCAILRAKCLSFSSAEVVSFYKK